MTIVNRRWLIRTGLFALAAGLVLAGCSSIERPKNARQAKRADVKDMVQMPPILEGTICSAAVLEGFQLVIVDGDGIVVGLAGAGASDVTPDVRAHMIAMAARHGIGSASAGYASISPEALIDSPDTAIVVVEGLIPPGAT